MQMRLVQPLSLAVLLLVASCGGDDTKAHSNQTPSTTGTQTSTAPTSSIVPLTTSTPAPQSTVPPASTTLLPSTVSTPTSAAADAGALVLRSGGLGALSFGLESASVLASVTAVFGVAEYDVSTEYQLNDESGCCLRAGRWQSEGEVFAYQYSRVVCWTVVLCVTFGGDTPNGQPFVGWSYHDAATVGAVALSTADGITLGSLLSDHLDSITLNLDTACFTVVTGSTVAGIEVSLFSVGEPFLRYDNTGALIKGNPPPQDIVVRELSDGDQVVDRDIDC